MQFEEINKPKPVAVTCCNISFYFSNTGEKQPSREKVYTFVCTVHEVPWYRRFNALGAPKDVESRGVHNPGGDRVKTHQYMRLSEARFVQTRIASRTRERRDMGVFRGHGHDALRAVHCSTYG